MGPMVCVMGPMVCVMWPMACVCDVADGMQVPGRPVIITNLVKHWPAFADWDFAALRRKFGNTPFIAGPLNISLNECVRPMQLP